jgi:hypothetical protein
MRRGYSQPTSSSISRSTGPGAREPEQRTRQGRNDVQTQADSVSARRDMSTQPYLIIPQQSADSSPASPASPGRKAPAYLEGKNPYGQILDSVDHPYRTPKVLGGTPSQVGATSESRPRTSGSFQFKTRPESKAESRSEVTEPDSLPSPRPRQSPIKPASVKAAKDFFEAKVSQGRSGPVFPPRGAATANKDETAKNLTVGNQPPSPPCDHTQAAIGQPEHVSRPNLTLDGQPNLDPQYPITPPPSHLSSDLEQSCVVNPFDLLQTTAPSSHAITHEAITRHDSPPFGSPETTPTSQKPTNISEAKSQDEQPPSYQRQADSSRPSKARGAHNAGAATRSYILNKTVRRGSTFGTIKAADRDKGACRVQ